MGKPTKSGRGTRGVELLRCRGVELLRGRGEGGLGDGGVERSPLKKNYFTVADDAEIAKAFQQPVESVSGLASRLSPVLGRSKESIRDRIKHYISRVPSEDLALLIRTARTSPKKFTIFSIDKEKSKRIKKFSNDIPVAVSRGAGPRAAKVTKKVSKSEEFGWVLDKINSRDPFFALENGISLLSDLLCYLVDTGRTDWDKVRIVLDAAKEGISLLQVLQGLGIQA